MFWFGNTWTIDVTNPNTKKTRSVEICIEAYIITFLTFGRGLYIDGVKQEGRKFDVCILCHWSPHLEWSYQATVEGNNIEIVFNSLGCPFTCCFDLFINGHLHGTNVSKADYYRKFSIISVARSLFGCILFAIIFITSLTTLTGITDMSTVDRYGKLLLASAIVSGSIFSYFGMLMISSLAAMIRFHYFGKQHNSRGMDAKQGFSIAMESLV
ncbi:hypothetical protein TrispH2_000727 [Trichoplax sp. H2]|nr:hypothetical protein TrispH2_000727 [Trichoplax sp. H2]|eukprot:RDD47597.1 hypothetical protein TrispH2_000727 [Trichoplax sp. H2]